MLSYAVFALLGVITVRSTLASTPNVAPSTTAAPPLLPRNSYNVTSADGTVCIRMDAVMQLKISYLSQNKIKESVIPIDESASVNKALSTCHGYQDSQVLAIDFADDYTISFTSSIYTLVNIHTREFFVSDITLNFTQDAKHFPDSDTPGRKESVHSEKQFLFDAILGFSYLCDTDSPLTLSNDVTLDVVSVQFQAFLKGGTTGKFGWAVKCIPPNVWKSVGIGMGVTVVVVVVIVLTAYLVVRHRRRQLHYQAV